MDSEEELILNQAVLQTEAEEAETTTAAPDVAPFPGPSNVTPGLAAVRTPDQAAAAAAAPDQPPVRVTWTRGKFECNNYPT
ncbi:hypothetical protein FQR65_LT17305 [Abscondita terminalis]|nr:hypothetical protein FQR65_LT17305 [Abscondita terminalis]